MIEFDLTILIQFVNFLILLAILNIVFFKPILKIQAERETAIDGARKATEGKIQELKDLKADYQAKLDTARQGAFDLVSAKVKAANQEREAQLKVINDEIDAKMAETREVIAKQEAELSATLKQEVDAVVTLILEQLIPATPTPSDEREEATV